MTGKHAAPTPEGFSSAVDAVVKPDGARLIVVLERVLWTLLEGASGASLVKGAEALFDFELSTATEVALIGLLSAVIAAVKSSVAVAAGSPDGSSLPVGARSTVDKDAVVTLKLPSTGDTVYGEAAPEPTGQIAAG